MYYTKACYPDNGDKKILSIKNCSMCYRSMVIENIVNKDFCAWVCLQEHGGQEMSSVSFPTKNDFLSIM